MDLEIVVALHNMNLCLTQQSPTVGRMWQWGPSYIQLFNGPGWWGLACTACETLYEARLTSGRRYFYSDSIGLNSITC